jgi:WD40 repeat protein
MTARLIAAAIVAASTVAAAPIPVTEIQRTEPVDFAKEVYPLLKQSCLACHNATKAKAELNLETPQLMLKGGDGGPAVIPGKGAESLLLRTAAHQDEDLIMPPPGNKAKAAALTSEQLGLVKLWIDQGAKGGAVADAVGPLPWRNARATGPVQSVSISPDGRLAAVARGNQVALCEITTGQTIALLGDPELAKLEPWKNAAAADRDAVMSVAFGSDDLIATGGFRTLRIWRRMPRVVERELGALPELATTLTASSDGKWAAAGDSKGTVWLWAMDAEKFEPAQLKHHSAAVSALSFSADGEALISAAEDKTVQVWSVADRVRIVGGEVPSAIRGLAVSPARGEVIAGCADGIVRVWPWLKEPPSALPPPVREFKMQDLPIQALSCIDPETFAWIGADGLLHLAKITDGTEIRKVTFEHPSARKIALLEGELQIAQSLVATRKAQVAAATEDAKKKGEIARAAAQNFEKAKLEARRRNDESDAAAALLGAGKDNKALQEGAKKAADAAGKSDAALRAARVNAELGLKLAGESAAALAAKEIAVVGAEAALAETQTALDGARKLASEPASPARQLLRLVGGGLVVLDEKGGMHHRNAETGALLEPVDPAGNIAPLPNGGLLSISADRKIRVTSARRIWALERMIGNAEDPALLADRVMSLAFSPDGRLLATGGGVPSRDGELKLWRVADGTLVRAFPKAHADAINCVSFSPDGELLATAAGDRFARVWRVSDGTRVGNMEGHTGHVLSVAWRGDGLALATGGADRSVRLWDTVNFRQTKNTNTFSAEIAAVFYVGPGDQLLIASGDRSIRIGDQPLPDASTFPFCVTSDATGKFVAAGGDDGILRIWTVADRKLTRTFAPPGK